MRTVSIPPVVSPHGGAVGGRQSLQDRFASRLAIHPGLNRKVVSYQGNRAQPGLRWMKYKEGFSGELVEALIEDAESVLDPFSGIGTTPLTAAGRGLKGTGIEIMPVGVLAGRAIAYAANGLSRKRLAKEGQSLLERLQSSRKPRREHAFRHVRITESAFPENTEAGLAKAREFIAGVDDEATAIMLNVACMSVLEEVSYTRKDGQYLRWDYRSGRKLRTRLHKGPVQPLTRALQTRLAEMLEDLGPLKARMAELSNPHVIRLLEGYFLEMAVVIAELGRVARPGGVVFMVNDNVQYHGEEVPVDLILSDFAEQSGFECRHIWLLARGKGNSSQQMGRFGRREIRKCMYKWVRGFPPCGSHCRRDNGAAQTGLQ